MVEWKEIRELFDTRNGYTPSTKENGFWIDGTIPWFKMDDIRENGTILDDSKLHITEKAVKGKGLFKPNSIILATSATIGEHALITVKHLCNQRFTNLFPKKNYENRVNMRFFYYYMFLVDEWCKQHTHQGGFASVDMEGLYKYLVPIPSLSEQNRIVGILDTFTSSIENLKQQIAERRKQFEYYRDQLLDLEGKENRLIGELFDFKNGLNKEKKYFGQGNPIVNYTDVYHNYKITSETLKGRVTLDDKEIERFRVQRGDVFFTRTSETPEEIGYAAVLLDDINNCTFSGFLLRARPTTNLLLPEYCSYCFSSYKVRQAIIKLSTYTTRALTNGTSLSKISIPVPSLEEQSRIVSILDTFEASISNLEAQLSQREKQYEYYRNKLLTFE